MPKINVYLPDDLAEAVKEAGVPVSAVCQRALEQAVRRITAIRQASMADLDDLDDDQPSGALAYLTARTRTTLRLALQRARAEGAPAVGTAHLLGGMLEEGTNLALHVLRAMDIDPQAAARALDRNSGPEETAPGAAGARAAAPPQAPASGDQAGVAEPHNGAAEQTGLRGGPGGEALQLSGPAAGALELAVTEATSLGHNYVGCEHLLLGLAAEPDGAGGRVLRELGAEPRPARRAVVAALAGYVHLRAQTNQAAPAAAVGSSVRRGLAQWARRRQVATARASPAALAEALQAELRPVLRRIERLEQHAGLAADAPDSPPALAGDDSGRLTEPAPRDRERPEGPGTRNTDLP